MNFSDVKNLTIPQGEVVSIKSTYNMIPYSIDTDGSIYNGCGYIDGYRLSSSGALKEYKNVYYTSTATGFIPVVNMDTIYIERCPWYNANSAMNYICAYDVNFNFIGAEYSSEVAINSGYCYGTKFVDSSSGNLITKKCVIKLKDNANIAYIRVSVTSQYVGEIIYGANIFVDTLSNCVELWQKQTYKNWVKYSTEADGVTIYNGGLGYKYGYRIRSGGAESANSDAKPSIIGYIPCKAGDIIRFCYENGVPIWMDEGSAYMTCLNFFDSSKANLGQLTSQPADYGIFDGTNEFNKIKKVGNYWEYTVANNVNIAFVRFTVPPATWGGANNADKLIITINEEIA